MREAINLHGEELLIYTVDCSDRIICKVWDPMSKSLFAIAAEMPSPNGEMLVRTRLMHAGLLHAEQIIDDYLLQLGGME